ncbi:ArsR family transcriptional regulator [Halorubellus sp. JP-L1]|uniref:ArsR family transcriptional regulator n=1 Tax=Halorubellus sp. JP-L1 TaxID=2715753 RepID=UPI00140D0DAA|nr:ArsR family transcriptional regulator [Halorubellus sp. JP-L1]NHN40068.1 ArsR family transcriptional regulator [Halorubellus sp. JP-L1]
MTPVDRDILELFENQGGSDELRLTPRVVAANTDWGRDAIRKHLLTLRDADLLEYYDEDAGLYQLSERGRAYLAGEVDVEELEDDDDE